MKAATNYFKVWVPGIEGRRGTHSLFPFRSGDSDVRAERLALDCQRTTGGHISVWKPYLSYEVVGIPRKTKKVVGEA